MHNYNENGINGITSCISPYKTVLWQARAEWMGNFLSFHFSAVWIEVSIKPKEWENKVFLSTDAGAKKMENSSWRLIIMQHNAIQWIRVPFYIHFFFFCFFLKNMNERNSTWLVGDPGISLFSILLYIYPELNFPMNFLYF